MKFKAKNEGKSASQSTSRPLPLNDFLTARVFCYKGNQALSILRRLSRVNMALLLPALLLAARPLAESSAEASIGTPASGGSTCTLPAPGSFNGERTGSTTAYLDWSPVTGAVAYRLMVYHKETQELVSNTVEYGVSRSLTSLESGVSYRCILASICSGGSTSDFIISDDILD